MLVCEDVAMDWDLDEVRSAQKRREEKRKRIWEAARREEWLEDMRIGRAITRARDRGVPQKAIADNLDLSREQVRRLAVAWREAVDKGEVSDADLDQ